MFTISGWYNSMFLMQIIVCLHAYKKEYKFKSIEGVTINNILDYIVTLSTNYKPWEVDEFDAKYMIPPYKPYIPTCEYLGERFTNALDANKIISGNAESNPNIQKWIVDELCPTVNKFFFQYHSNSKLEKQRRESYEIISEHLREQIDEFKLFTMPDTWIYFTLYIHASPFSFRPENDKHISFSTKLKEVHETFSMFIGTNNYLGGDEMSLDDVMAFGAVFMFDFNEMPFNAILGHSAKFDTWYTRMKTKINAPTAHHLIKNAE